MKRKQIFLLAAVLLLALILNCLFNVSMNAGIDIFTDRIRIDGFSMEPTLKSGDLLVINKLAYRRKIPDYGDLILFQYPRDPRQEYLKRVIGLPGDNVRIVGRELYINDQLIDEPYIAAAPNYHSTWDIPENSLFVLGDNRNRSSDSHNWGPIDMEFVIGKAYMIYWPPDRSRIIEHFNPVTGTASP